MFKRLLSIGAGLLATMTAACEDGPATVPGGWRSAATWSSMVHASAAGPLWVEILGRPFAATVQSDDSVNARVASAMTNQLVGRGLVFTARREQAARPEFRVILAFNPPAAADPRALCAGRVAPDQAAAEKVTVLAAFCDQSGLLASVKGWVAKVDGPDDPRFRRLLGQVVRDLFGAPA